MIDGPHVSIGAETLFNLGGLAFTNSMLTGVIISALIILFAIITRIKLDKDTTRPTGIQNVAEWMVESFYKLVHTVASDSSRSRFFFPLITTFFFFILLNNWSGLIPGVGSIGFTEFEQEHQTTAKADTLDAYAIKADSTLNNQSTQQQPVAETISAESNHQQESAGTFVPFFRPATADLNTTLALALISVIAVQFVGVRFAKLAYFKKFINFSSPIMFFVGILEIVSEFAKIISFTFRLFGNIFAGEVLLVIITFLVPILLPVPFYGLEIFVGFIQALVFAMLSLVFFNMATQKH